MDNKEIDIDELLAQYNGHISTQTQEIMVLRAMLVKLRAKLAELQSASDKVE